MEYVKAVEQVEAKTSGRHVFFEIAVAGRDDAHVGDQIASSAHAAERGGLEGAEELGLNLCAQLPDFIQEAGCRPRPIRAGLACRSWRR